MKVAIVTPVFPPYHAGMAVAAADEARALAAAGDEVTIITPAYPGRSLPMSDGVHALRPLLWWGNAACIPGAVRAIAGADVVHLHCPFFGTAVLVALVARARQMPLVVTWHMRPSAVGMKGIILSLMDRCARPLIFACAHTVIVASLDYARAHGVQHRRLVEIPFGVDTAVFSPAPQRPPHDLTAIFVGGMDAAHAFKGVEVLLRALAQTTYPWRLIAVGDGELRPEYAALAQRLGIADRVHWRGALSRDALAQAYRESDLHILPSLSAAEAFGIVTLEAMASGIPSLVSDLPGVRTLVHDGANGATFSAGESAALARALDDIAQDAVGRARWGLTARARAQERYDARILAARLRETLSSVC